MYLLPQTAPPASPSSLVQLGAGVASVDSFVAAMRAWKGNAAELTAVRDHALELVQGAPAQNEVGEVRRLFEFVRDAVRYVRDVNGVDTLQTPSATLARLQGDCDDKTLLLAALLESVGYASRFVVSATHPLGPYNHVYLETWIPRLARWVALEPSVRLAPFGRALPSFRPVRRYA